MKSIQFFILFTLMFISFQVFAHTLVFVENETDVICYLENKNIKLGTLINEPSFIVPDDVGEVLIESAGFSGQNSELTYRCGGKKIKIICQESWGVMSAGTVSAKLGYADAGITGTYQLEDGALIYKQWGVIRWKINWS